MTIKKKLMFLIVFCVIMPTLLIPISGTYLYEDILKSKINELTQQNMAQIANNITVATGYMVSASSLLYNSKELKDTLVDNNTQNDWMKVERFKKIQSLIQNTQFSTLSFFNANIFVFDLYGNTFSTATQITSDKLNNYKQTDWFKRVMQGKGNITWIAPAGIDNDFDFIKENDIVLIRAIKDDSNGICGAILIVLNTDDLMKKVVTASNLQKDLGVTILNENKNIISSNDKNLDKVEMNQEVLKKYFTESSGSFQYKSARETELVSYYKIKSTGWELVQITPYNSLMKEVHKLRNLYISVSLLFIIVLVIVSLFISTSIANPLHQLSMLMKEVPKGNFAVRMKVNGKSEVAQLGNSFNTMVIDMQDLINELHMMHEAREKLRLETLQAQINPHFLFNTLNSIKWMAAVNGDTEVSKMLAALGILLEESVGKVKEMIPLEEELKCLENYVILQKMRFGDKFEMEMRIPDELLGYKVPSLILQPIVENSIIHAFEDMDSGGIIVISGKIEAEKFMIEVWDNGKGMDQDKAEGLLKCDNKKAGRWNNIGVKNVNDRLRLHYGQGYGLQIESTEGKGTKISLYMLLKGGIEHVEATHCR